jgi:cell division protein FtsB
VGGYQNTLWRQVRAEKKKRSYVFWILALLSLFYLALTLLLGDMGYLKYRKLKKKGDALKAEIAQVRGENARLRALLEDFRKNDYYLEKHAREEFGLSKKDEYIFLFEEEKDRGK